MLIEKSCHAQCQNVFKDILFELSLQGTGNQHSILANLQNKAMIISKLMMVLTDADIACH